VNYLVHLYLVGNDLELQLGSMMGDFVKGAIPEHFPDKIRQGLQHHRSLDTFAHSSAHCRTSRLRLDDRYGHVRSVMVDIFYDHFLAVHWSDYHSLSLEEFAARFYLSLQTHAQWLPEGLAQVAPRMRDRNWLVAYRQKAVVERALQHLSTRLSRPTPLGEGLVELDRHEEGLYQDFVGFMEEAKGLGSPDIGTTDKRR